MVDIPDAGCLNNVRTVFESSLKHAKYGVMEIRLGRLAKEIDVDGGELDWLWEVIAEEDTAPEFRLRTVSGYR